MRAATIRIYTQRGEWLRTLQKDDRLLYADWDLCNAAGKKVAPGIYLFRIESPEGSVKKGKLMVIR
ncbi:hypothetical protein HGA89_01440 [bacterium]|nr:hypothetical protein [bacterium]